MDPYRIEFGTMAWESPIPGVRHKAYRDDGRTLRLVEYSREMEPHWCTRGHFGVILEGRFKIEFPAGTHVFESGDGVFIPGGESHRHRATAITETVVAVFVEDD